MLRIPLVSAVWLLVSSALAAACDSERTHVTKAGEDLFFLAAEYYGDREKWSVIYNANAPSLGGINPNFIPRGVRLRIPCLGVTDDRGRGTTDSRSASSPRQRVDLELLTGGDYAPFTDQDLEEGGVVSEIVLNAFEVAPYPITFRIEWNDAWGEHLQLLLDGEYQAGFPWLKPSCEENPGNFRCANFQFSEPVFEMLVMLFVRKDAPIGFETDEAIHGKRVCRPTGYYTHDLDRADRRWISDGRIVYIEGDSPADCFRRLADGAVDAVTLNEFTGRRTVADLGLEDEIIMEPRPVSVEGLHVIFPKNHWRATTFNYRFNAGVVNLRESKQYDQIVDRHMSAFWQSISGAEEDAEARSGTVAEAPAGDAEEERTGQSTERSGRRGIARSADPEADDRSRLIARLRRPSELPFTPRAPGNGRSGIGEDEDGTGPQTSHGDNDGERYDVADRVRLREQFDRSFFVMAALQTLVPTDKDWEYKTLGGSGTGFLVAPDIVLTNAHVAASADVVVVANRRYGRLNARVIDYTPRFETGDLDFALLRLEERLDIEPVVFSSVINVLDDVYAYGFPGKTQGVDQAYLRFIRGSEDDVPTGIASTGAIQARLRNASNVDTVLHDAEISQGNSGGPLLDGCGRVLGINTFTSVGDTTTSTAQYEAAISAESIVAYLRRNGIDPELRNWPCRAAD